MAAKIFISYRNVALSRLAGDKLYVQLTENGYEVFFDQERLKDDGGVDWEDVLETNVRTADVLIVLIQPETAESSWVRKEIDMAREVFAGIVPLIVDAENDIHPTLEKMELSELQYLPYEGKDHELADVIKSIKNRAAEAREQRAREQFWQESEDAQYRLVATPDLCSVELVTGDATQVGGYDVLVNTENNYMQMARYFESNTLSGTIRWNGAWHDEGGYIRDDTVQLQLNDQIRLSPHYPGVPVRQQQIVITEAGHPKSKLARMDFRFIFHAATVTVDRYSRRVDSIALQAIPDVVVECLYRLESINDAQGAVMYVAEGELEPARADFAPLTSILFPLIGAGKGGHDEYDSAKAIIDGIKKYLKQKNHQGTVLETIGICVYNPQDARAIDDYFSDSGFERS